MLWAHSLERLSVHKVYRTAMQIGRLVWSLTDATSSWPDMRLSERIRESSASVLRLHIDYFLCFTQTSGFLMSSITLSTLSQKIPTLLCILTFSPLTLLIIIMHPSALGFHIGTFYLAILALPFLISAQQQPPLKANQRLNGMQSRHLIYDPSGLDLYGPIDQLEYWSVILSRVRWKKCFQDWLPSIHVPFLFFASPLYCF